MIKRLDQILEYGPHDKLFAEDRREVSKSLPLPTLDDRVNLYLRAIHGEREFTREERSFARELILGAMAINAGVNIAEEKKSPPQEPIYPGDETPTGLMYSPMAEKIAASKSVRAPHALPLELELESVSQPKPFIAADRHQTARFPIRQPQRYRWVKRTFLTVAQITAVAAVVLVAVISVFHSTRFDTGSNSSSLIAQGVSKEE